MNELRLYVRTQEVFFYKKKTFISELNLRTLRSDDSITIFTIYFFLKSENLGRNFTRANVDVMFPIATQLYNKWMISYPHSHSIGIWQFFQFAERFYTSIGKVTKIDRPQLALLLLGIHRAPDNDTSNYSLKANAWGEVPTGLEHLMLNLSSSSTLIYLSIYNYLICWRQGRSLFNKIILEN